MRGFTRGSNEAVAMMAGPGRARAYAVSEPGDRIELDGGERVPDFARANADADAAVEPATCAELQTIHPDFRAILRAHCTGCRGAGGPCMVRELRALLAAETRPAH